MATLKTILISTAITATVAVSLFAAGLVMADSRVEKTLVLDPGGRFVLDTEAGSVTLTGVSGSGAKVVVTSKEDDLAEWFDLSFEEAAGVVTVRGKKKATSGGSWGSWSGRKGPHFELQVPTRTTLQLETGGGHVEASSVTGNTTIETAGGHISLSSIEGKITASTSGGHIELKEIRGDGKAETAGGHIEVAGLTGALEARTAGGHLRLAGVGGDIRASTSGGHVKVEEAGGRVEAETSGGQMDVGFARGNSRGGLLETAGGSVEVRVDGGVDLTVDASTGGGSVSSSLAIVRDDASSRTSLRGALGKGGQLLKVRTSAGSIRIDAR